jgi:hypothetical protein
MNNLLVSSEISFVQEKKKDIQKLQINPAADSQKS